MSTIRESILSAIGDGAKTKQQIVDATGLEISQVANNLYLLKTDGYVVAAQDGLTLGDGVKRSVYLMAKEDERKADAATTTHEEIPRFTSKRQQQQAARANGAAHKLAEAQPEPVRVAAPDSAPSLPAASEVIAPAALSTVSRDSRTTEFDTPDAAVAETVIPVSEPAQPVSGGDRVARTIALLDDYLDMMESCCDPDNDPDGRRLCDAATELREWLANWGGWKAPNQQTSVLLYGINERGQVSIERQDGSGQRAVIEREDVLRLMQFLTLVRPVLEGA